MTPKSSKDRERATVIQKRKLPHPCMKPSWKKCLSSSSAWAPSTRSRTMSSSVVSRKRQSWYAGERSSLGNATVNEGCAAMANAKRGWPGWLSGRGTGREEEGEEEDDTPPRRLLVVRDACATPGFKGMRTPFQITVLALWTRWNRKGGDYEGEESKLLTRYFRIKSPKQDRARLLSCPTKYQAIPLVCGSTRARKDPHTRENVIFPGSYPWATGPLSP